MSVIDVSPLEQKLGIYFRNKDLFIQALVHRSYLNEHPDFYLDHNERLEFLGDAVLELIVTEHLYTHYPNSEGDLTSWRAALVNAVMLGKIAHDIGLNEFLLLSRGEAKDVGKARQFILANTFEAIVGALYLDRGYKTVFDFIERVLLRELPHIVEEKLYRDPKSSFQEEAQEKVGITPSYRVLDERGPDHEKHFIVGVMLGSEIIAKGEGSSKQEAETNAAKHGLEVKKW